MLLEEHNKICEITALGNCMFLQLTVL